MQTLTRILFAVLVVAVTACENKVKDAEKSKPSNKSLDQIKDRYVVFIKPTHIPPLILDTTFNTLSKEAQMKKRIAVKSEVQKICKEHNLNVDDSNIFVDVAVAFVVTMDEATAAEVRSDERVQSAERDVIIQGKPIQQGRPIQQGKPIQQDEDGQPEDWGLSASEGDCLMSCAVARAGGSADGSSKSEVIWIIDTGIANHPFLNVNTELGMNFTVVPRDKRASDDNGHGTLVAGIAGARQIDWDGIMICAGVSAGASLVPLKVLDSQGIGTWSDILEALDYIAKFKRTGDVINMSLGDYPILDCQAEIPGLVDVLDRISKIHFVVMASGNNGGNASQSLPGCIDINGSRELHTVGAINCNETCADYSNYGSSVDWVAVGTDVFSTSLQDSTGVWTYRVGSGTSMSAAVISGVIHLRGNKPRNGDLISCGVRGPGNASFNYHIGIR